MTRKIKYEYIVIDDRGVYPEDARKFESTWEPENPEYVAEDAAEHDYDQCDGWDRQDDEITIEVYHKEKKLGRFEVTREAVPSFSATEKKT